MAAEERHAVPLDRSQLLDAAQACGEDPLALEAMLHEGGFPAERRAALWLAVSGASARMAALPGRFEALAAALDPARRAVRAIERDLDRTLPRHPLFRETGGAGQLALRRVLHAYAELDPGIGYCQGMNFLAATCLVATDGAAEPAFWLLVGAMERMHALFEKGVPGFLAVMDRLGGAGVPALAPRVAERLEELGMGVQFVAAAWVHALCCVDGALPLESTLAVWDAFWVYGLPALGRAWLALFVLSQQDVVALPLEGVLPFYRELAVPPQRLLPCMLSLAVPRGAEGGDLFPPELTCVGSPLVVCSSSGSGEGEEGGVGVCC